MMFKVGDKVRLKVGSFVSEYSIFGLSNEALCKESEYELGKVYTVSKISCKDNRLLNVEELLENCYIDCFELAFPPLPDYRDLASVVKPTPYDVSLGAFYERLQKTLSNHPPTTTKIIHNGTTTVTQFNDGTKIITRPSETDADKFDPFIGWCVGVVEKLYGGKEKAKRFYKEHAVVQKVKGKVETVEVEPTYHRCNECKYHKHSGDYDPCKSCISDYIKNNFKTSIGWQPKEQK